MVLISPKENVQNLVRASAGVITLSSTLGMESALAGKPTYALGDVSYEYHPWCTRVKNFDELEEKIRFDIQHPKSLLGLDAMNLRFAVSYLRNTIQGNIFDPNTRDTNNYDAIFAYVRDRAISARTK
ncbi:MAG: WcnU [Candidatus Woesebacteria bacterium GW2011_GWB1_45_5]|uniref:WcnU n=1 Tax=Candidatus Woesebacteria bacterium GW2011_GWB1_45_5 TaxID=1618581 RepID=A0A0G1MR53_9BACT|nr:MAG: WcnU [Candidatus Woesebacteria bacterium GW2011_GWB1_45_5]